MKRFLQLTLVLVLILSGTHVAFAAPVPHPDCPANPQEASVVFNVPEASLEAYDVGATSCGWIFSPDAPTDLTVPAWWRADYDGGSTWGPALLEDSAGAMLWLREFESAPDLTVAINVGPAIQFDSQKFGITITNIGAPVDTEFEVTVNITGALENSVVYSGTVGAASASFVYEIDPALAMNAEIDIQAVVSPIEDDGDRDLENNSTETSATVLRMIALPIIMRGIQIPQGPQPCPVTPAAAAILFGGSNWQKVDAPGCGWFWQGSSSTIVVPSNYVYDHVVDGATIRTEGPTSLTSDGGTMWEVQQ